MSDTPQTSKKKLRDLELVATCVLLLEEKHVNDISIYDVRGKSSITDFFVVGSVKNPRQMKAAGDNVTRQLKKRGVRALHQDGQTADNVWVVLDYLDCIVHLFTDDTRIHYNIEDLWHDCAMPRESLPAIVLRP